MTASELVLRALMAVTALRTHLLMTDAIVMNPVDWQTIQDYGLSPIPFTLWGQPVILSDRVAQGKPMAATWGGL